MSAVRVLLHFRKGTTLWPVSKNAARKWPVNVLTWTIEVNTVVPLWAAYGLGPVVITTLKGGPAKLSFVFFDW